MQIALLPEGGEPEHAFESGLSAKLMDTSFKAKKLRSEANYRCRHCVPAGESADASADGEEHISTGESASKESQEEDKKKRQRHKKNKFRAMDFNALRS